MEKVVPILLETAMPPIISTSVVTAVEMPAFTLTTPIPPTQIVTTTPLPETATVTPISVAPIVTRTPEPTFTPPALPNTQASEHYWLRRPIPDGGTVWTDKAYPYGNTQGSTLRPHHGVEFYVPSGTDVLATASGTVRVAGTDSIFVYGPEPNFYGNLVVIELDSRLNGQPVYNLYGHLSELRVTEGQHVEALELIALSGASGVADGSHLHLEVRVGKNSYAATYNPLLWLYPFPDRGVIAGRITWPNGDLVYEAPVTLNRIDAPTQYHATTSYAQESLNADRNWGESFAFDDVEAGYYEVVVQVNSKKFKQEVWVYPYRTNFVEIVLEAGE